jgi:cytochrome c
MKKDETRKILLDDIENFRSKAKYYESLHLFEAEKYATNLASNLELALTTMPSDDDTEIAWNTPMKHGKAGPACSINWGDDMDSHLRLAWALLLVPALLVGCGREEPSQSDTAAAPPPLAQPEAPKAAEPAPQAAAPQAEPAQAPAAAPSPAPAAPAGAPDAKADALALAGKSGCLACHAVDRKLVGPAWKDVAARYRGDASARSKLIEKVSKGGAGNWTAVTGGIPMPANAPRVPPEDIAKLVDFVLSL